MKNLAITTIFLFAIPFLFGQEKPLQAHFGLYIKDLRLQEQIKNKANLFTADFYWWLRCENIKDTAHIKEIENFEFVNSQIQEFHIDEKRLIQDSITGLSMVYLSGHMKGDFIFEPDYRHYPFDKLVLPITVESFNLTSDKLFFVPDTTAYQNKTSKTPEIASNFSISTFSILKTQYKEADKVYETSFGDPRLTTSSAYSSLTYEVVLERKSSIFFLKILIPIMLIALMAYLVFFIPHSMLQAAVGLTVTSLLSSIALQLSMSNNIPTTGYLIATDKLFYIAYALITSAMILSVYAYNLDRKERTKRADKITLIAKYIYPIVFIVFTFITIRNGMNYYP